MNAQRQSRDANIFRRVVDRIKVCVEEATAPATAGDTAAAGETEKLAGSSTVSGVSGRPESLTSGSSTKKGKGKAKADAGAGTGDAPCNWALAHAACRVCRVVGRTFQVAIRCVHGKGGRRQRGTGPSQVRGADYCVGVKIACEDGIPRRRASKMISSFFRLCAQ